MATKRITMRKIREVLRLHFAAQLRAYQISDRAKVCVGAMVKLLTKARALSLSWPLPDELDDSVLASPLFSDVDHQD